LLSRHTNILLSQHWSGSQCYSSSNCAIPLITKLFTGYQCDPKSAPNYQS